MGRDGVRRSGRCARATACFLGLAATAPAFAQPFQAQGIDLLSWRDLQAFGINGLQVPANGNSCWGYVSPSGREYAIMGLENQAAFIEITDPRNPVIIAQIPHPDSLWADIKVFGQYAYVSNETGGGVQVIDMGQIDQGIVTLVRSITSQGLTTSHTLAVNPESPVLWLAGSNAAGSGGSLVSYLLTDPSNPVYAGQWIGPYTHEAQVTTWRRPGPWFNRQIAFLYNGAQGMVAADVTDPANMVTLSTRTYAGIRYAHQGWTTDDQRYVHMNDELDGPAQGVPYALTRVFDVADLANPVLVNTFSGAVPTATDHNNYIQGRYSYQANYTSGLRVFDLNASPTNPPEVAWFDTYPENNGNSFNGAWSNYPYFPSGTIIISDINRGFFAVRLNLNFLTFQFPFGTPTELQPGRRTLITVDVSSAGTPLDPATVALNVRVNAGSPLVIPMIQTGPSRFAAAIPAAPCNSTVEYSVSAQNTAGASFSSNTFPASARGVAVVSSFFDMELDQGWVGGQTGDTATSGRWERGDPEPTTAPQPGDDHTPPPGVNCWVTGRLAGASVGANDVDNGFTTLVSPVINLAAADPAVRIGYHRWYVNSNGGDVLKIDFSSNGGTTWTRAETVGPTGAGTTGGWVYAERRIADIVPLTSTFRVRVIAEDLGAGNVVEAALDDVSIFTPTCPPACPGDWNADGAIDFNDLLDFLNDYNTSLPITDLTSDGIVDFNDLLEFLNDYNAPC